MANKDFNISINTKKTGNGAEETKAELDAVKKNVENINKGLTGTDKAAKEAAKSSREMDRQMDAAADRTERTGREMSDVQKETRRASQEARELKNQFENSRREAEALKTAVMTGLSVEVTRRISNALMSIPQQIEQATKRGIAFNSQLETAENAVAAILLRFRSHEFATFEEAMLAAGDGVEYLKQRALEAPGGIQELVQGFSSVAGAGFSAGLQMQEIIDLTVKTSQAMSMLGLNQNQLTQELRAIFTGNITPDAMLAKTLGITAESVRQAKELGNFYQFIDEAIGSMGRSADTFEVSMSNTNDAIDEMLGRLNRQSFMEVRGLIDEVRQQIEAGNLEDSLKPFFDTVESGIVLFQKLFTLFAENGNTISSVTVSLAKMGLGIGTVIAVTKLLTVTKRFLVGLLAQSTGGITAETAALVANTRAQQANASSVAAGNAVRRTQMFASTGAAVMGGALAGTVVYAALMAAIDKMAADVERADRASKAFSDNLKEARDVFRTSTNIDEFTKEVEKLDAEIAKIEDRLKKNDAARLSKMAAGPGDRYRRQPTLDADEIRNLETQLRLHRALRETLESRKESQAELNAEAAKQKRIEEENRAAAERTKLEYQELARDLPKLKKELEDLRISQMDPQGQVAALQARVDAMVEPNRAELEALYGAEAAEAKMVQHAIEREKLEGTITAIKERQAQLDKQAADRDREKAKRAEQEARRQQEAQRSYLADLAVMRARAAGDEERARRLEGEERIRQDILRLQREGFDLEQARRLATERENLSQQINARNDQRDPEKYDAFGNLRSERRANPNVWGWNLRDRAEAAHAAQLERFGYSAPASPTVMSSSVSSGSAQKVNDDVEIAKNMSAEQAEAVTESGNAVIEAIDNLGKSAVDQFNKISTRMQELAGQIKDLRNN